jgi:uracil-DNA glycosylase family 4
MPVYSKSLSPATPVELEGLIKQARACQACVAQLPHSPRPILRATGTARLLVVGQAPGRKVHETGIPWNDPSGDLLRDWLGLSREQFYDENTIAIIPTGLCYPGSENGADLPPRPECAPLWHPPLRAALRNIRLTLLIGRYAQAYYLGNRQGRTLADTVRAYRDFLPDFFPLPHPSPRNRRWLRDNDWFGHEVLPMLQKWVDSALKQ